MPRIAEKIVITPEQRAKLEELANSHSNEYRLVIRAKILLECESGKLIKVIAKEFNEQEVTIRKWRDRYKRNGIEGLNDLPRSGTPKLYDDKFIDKLLLKMKDKPPHGIARWNGALLAKELNVSDDAVWRVLRKKGICLERQRTWCVSTDPEFATKAADIVGLYLNPPTNAIVISVDEKPSIQALSRPTGYVCTSNKKIVNGIKSTYKRNGTINLFAALEVATGIIYTKNTKTKTRQDFLSYMDDLLNELNMVETNEIHVILDNYCIHKRCDDWLKKHPNVYFHYTPTSASWLNQIEIWFGIMTRKVLRGASFDSTNKLVEAIKKYVKYYNDSAHPFIWRKREVKGSQLKDTVKNLCN